MMKSYMGAILHKGARPIGQVNRGIDLHGGISPVQVPGFIPSTCYPRTTNLPFEVYQHSREEESQEKPGDPTEYVASVPNQSNQVLSEHKLNTISGQNRFESGSGLAPLPKSEEITQLKQGIGADNLPVITQSRMDKAGEPDAGSFPREDSSLLGKGKSISKKGPSDMDSKSSGDIDSKRSRQNRSESGSGLTPLPKSEEITQLKQGIGSGLTPLPKSVEITQLKQGIGSGLTPLPKSVEITQLKQSIGSGLTPLPKSVEITQLKQGIGADNLPVTNQSRLDKPGKPDVGSFPREDSSQRGKGRSVSESAPSIKGSSGRVEDAEKPVHFSKPLDLTQSFIKKEVHKSQTLIHSFSNHTTKEGSNMVSIAPVPHQSYQEDQGSKTDISQRSPANKALSAQLVRPSETAKHSQGIQEIMHPQGKRVPLPGSTINHTPSYHSENTHKLTINRLNIQVINQGSATPPQQAPRTQMPHVSPDPGEVLDRYYLKHFWDL